MTAQSGGQLFHAYWVSDAEPNAVPDSRQIVLLGEDLKPTMCVRSDKPGPRRPDLRKGRPRHFKHIHHQRCLVSLSRCCCLQQLQGDLCWERRLGVSGRLLCPETAGLGANLNQRPGLLWSCRSWAGVRRIPYPKPLPNEA